MTNQYTQLSDLKNIEKISSVTRGGLPIFTDRGIMKYS